MNENQEQYSEYNREQQLERVVTIGEWLRLQLVGLFSLIPFVGWIIMLVIYIVKATDTRRPQSYRNLIKAGFIWVGICFAVSILLIIFLMAYGLTTDAFIDAIERVR